MVTRCGIVEELLENTLQYARQREYKGYDYSDGLSSTVLQKLPVENKWVNIAFQESAKRAPVNIRPLLLIPKRRSFKGSGLFIMANVAAYEMTGREMYLDQAETLVDWLLETRRDQPFGWGHNHDIQTLNTTVERNTPSIVSVTYITLGILEFAKHRDTEAYSLVRDGVPDLIFDTLEYSECDAGAHIKYKSTQKDGVYTLNANALGGRLLMELYHEFGDDTYRDRAESILDYVVSHQTSIGGWKYTDPPSASHLSMDNHHNGFIIESLLRHEELAGSQRYESALDDSLSFYKNILYEDDGRPNWDEERSYPRDIHAATQGIITFSRSGDLELASKILDWTLGELYAGDGQFHYRKQKYYTKRFTLMRWCEAWMAYALSVYHRANR
jgi:hypothetical protein